MILTVYSGREEGEWFDIDVPDECTIEHLKTLLGVRIFGQAPGDGIQYILEAKFPEGLWFSTERTAVNGNRAEARQLRTCPAGFFNDFGRSACIWKTFIVSTGQQRIGLLNVYIHY